jgi:hypothetical protein
LTGLLNVGDRLAVVPRVDVLDPVAVERGRPGRQHVWDAKPLCMAVVERGIHEADIVACLSGIPQVRSCMAAVPSLFNEQGDLRRHLDRRVGDARALQAGIRVVSMALEVGAEVLARRLGDAVR